MENVSMYDFKSNEETRTFVEDLANFCKMYVSDVCNVVINQVPMILNNKHIMNLLHELRLREEQERIEFADRVGWRVYEVLFQDCKENNFDLHNYCTTHSGSYRDVLYDMLIKNYKKEEE